MFKFKDPNFRKYEDRFDHGELNIPLAKRQKNFDSDLKKYKKEQEQEKRRKQAEMSLARMDYRVAKNKALELLKQVPRERIKELADQTGISMTEARQNLKFSCEENPEYMIKALIKELEK